MEDEGVWRGSFTCGAVGAGEEGQGLVGWVYIL